MHADTTQRLLDENVDLQQQLTDGHFDAVRAKEGGLDAQFFSIWVEPQLFGGGGRERDEARRRSNRSRACARGTSIRKPGNWPLRPPTFAALRAEGKIAALLGLEGGYAIDESWKMSSAITNWACVTCRRRGA